MKKTFLKAAIASSVILASGCASIMNDETQAISIVTSNGQEINGTINGKPFTGPGTVQVQRAKEDAIVVVDEENCRQTVIPSSIDMKFGLNALFGLSGLFSSTTDHATDKMWEYENTSVMIFCK